jgi:hypothetical protein
MISCNDSSQSKLVIEKKYSITQTHLFQLPDKYKTDYFAGESPKAKNEIQAKYLETPEHFLVDSLGRQIDSMTVIVDTVIQEGWLVTTQFHQREIEFKYGMSFKDSMDSKNDSRYKFMKSLKPKKE